MSGLNLGYTRVLGGSNSIILVVVLLSDDRRFATESCNGRNDEEEGKAVEIR